MSEKEWKNVPIEIIIYLGTRGDKNITTACELVQGQRDKFDWYCVFSFVDLDNRKTERNYARALVKFKDTIGVYPHRKAETKTMQFRPVISIRKHYLPRFFAHCLLINYNVIKRCRLSIVSDFVFKFGT